ncbi:MAG: single-stranded-DNA-specific exonuclease RecJ [Anaerolineaceae bacterium]|nr:MAG: single-stranded-DNA-specific exonuclease RecJ [Anaerolineaceae bacterium]
MQSKKWHIATRAPESLLRRFDKMSPAVAQVMVNRGFDDPAKARTFLYDKRTTHDPFTMPDMQKAVERILHAIREREKIVIYGDFDADGVTSTALMVQALQALNADVAPYIPHRVDEGYGLNDEALDKIRADGASLVVTVDCGIRSISEVEHGRDIGLDIIVTDHHSLGAEIPAAYAVLNPKIDGYAEDMLAGVGMAFKLVQALIMAAGRDRFFADQKRADGSNYIIPLESLFDLVAIGTVADLMPLDRLENRVLVRRGLEVLNRAERPGIRAMLELAGVQMGTVTATTIGFVIGPRINAAGRLGDAMLAYDLLTTSDAGRAALLAEQLQELNTRRQSMTRDAQQTIAAQLGDNGDTPALIFAGDPHLEAGIVGLVAGRLTETYFRPAVIMEQGETESRASCRSIPQFDITGALDQCADLLVRHGGHALAAGFTVQNQNVPALRERLTAMAQDALSGQTLVPTLAIDAELSLNELSERLVSELALLEPCGHGNPQPTFLCRNVHVADYRAVGQTGDHLKMKISRAAQPPLDAIGFRLGEWVGHMPERVDIAFQLEVNEWNGRRSLQANLQDIRRAETHD